MKDKMKPKRGNALGELIGLAVAQSGVDHMPVEDHAQSGSEVIEIAAGMTRMNDLHRRMNATMQGSAIEELVESMRSVGQQQEAKGWRLDKPEDGVQVVLIYGARRRAAAEKLGIPLRVRIVPEPTRAQLIRDMHAENRARKDYLPLEMAKEMQAYLESGEYANATELAAGLGEDKSKVSRLLALLKLPKEVLSLYSDPTWMKLFAGSKLATLCEEAKVRARVLEAAQTWAKSGARGNPTATLLKAAAGKTAWRGGAPDASLAFNLMDREGRVLGTMRGSLQENQPLVVSLGKSTPAAFRKELAELLERHFAKKAQ
jgi:ParB/RepB/Spo0J family partition protein